MPYAMCALEAPDVFEVPRRGKVRIVVRVRNSEGNIALYDATLTDMLENPDIQGIVCNYSKVPLLEDEG